MVLKPENISRIDGWISQFNKKQPALRVSRQSVANFIIQGHPNELSDEELTKLTMINFSAVRYTQWITQEVKDAAARGENVTPEKLLGLFMDSQNGNGQ